jgi:parvulin-like peptidyl-prolyl isomerase
LSDEQFKTVLENIKRENKLDTEEKFQGALKQENMTMADLRRQLERSMIIQRVQQNEVFGRIGVTDEEARAYYDAHLAEFTSTASVTLREILVSVPNDGKTINVGLDEAAKDQAEAIRARASGGEDFAKLAAEVSAAPSRANGGLIGPLSMNDLSPELRKLIEPLQKDGLSPVVRTQRGFQFFKIEALIPAETLPFEKAREQINDRVFTSKRKEEFQKYLVKLRSQAIIDWKNDDVKKAYEEGVAQAQNVASPAS